MVLCGTNVFRDEIREGKDHRLLEQLNRRGILKKQLPDASPIRDIRAICIDYGLTFPAARRGERWKNFPRSDQWDILRDLAYFHGLKRLTLTLNCGQKVARKAGKKLDWSYFVRAHQIFANLELPETV